MNETLKLILELAPAFSVLIGLVIQLSLLALKAKANKTEIDIADITKCVIEAEKLLGAGQGAAKMQGVQNKLNDKSKATKKKINEVVEVLNTPEE